MEIMAWHLVEKLIALPKAEGRDPNWNARRPEIVGHGSRLFQPRL